MTDEGGTTRCWRVEGRVQGVGFRWYASRVACAFGLAGSVRNLPDGAVEVVARGGPETLRRLEEALLNGPAGSCVDKVLTLPVSEPLEHTGFRVLR